MIFFSRIVSGSYQTGNGGSSNEYWNASVAAADTPTDVAMDVESDMNSDTLSLSLHTCVYTLSACERRVAELRGVRVEAGMK